jgi:dihydroflavonol-4-reductase
MAGETVLVTGGSGFVAGWCIERLLKAGYAVNTTVRSLNKEARVRETLSAYAPDAADPARLRFFAADLMADAGWVEAVDGCRYVLHVASPLSGDDGIDDEATYIRPARDGALRVLTAAVAAGVERVVLTSSMGAVAYGHPKSRYTSGKPFDEQDWSDPTKKDASAYVRSKIIAERAAWDFMKTDGGKTQLTVINPAGIFGPAMSKDFSGSLNLIVGMLRGAMAGLPPIGFSVVDVRDLADLHLLAMTKPEAAGRRFPAGGEFLWFADVADILRKELPAEMTRKIPTRQAPAWLLRIMGLWNPQVRALNHMLNRSREMSQDAALGLGWKPRSSEACLVDTAMSLKAIGVV